MVDLDRLVELLKDRYTSEEIVEKLCIPVDDLIDYLYDYIDDNKEIRFADELEELSSGSYE